MSDSFYLWFVSSLRCWHVPQSIYWQFILWSGSNTTKPRCLDVSALWVMPTKCNGGRVCSVMWGAVPCRYLSLLSEDSNKESICLTISRDANGTSPKCKPAAIPCDVTSLAFIFSRETFFNTPDGETRRNKDLWVTRCPLECRRYIRMSSWKR